MDVFSLARERQVGAAGMNLAPKALQDAMGQIRRPQ